MSAIKFSVCKDPNDANEPYEAVFASFFQARRTSVESQIIPWANYKQEMMSIALYGKAMDVAQVGQPVISDLIAMNAIRPFTPREIETLGGASAFVPAAWNTWGESKDVYAIPFILDGRAIVYWQDMLEDAGVDESTAFTSFDNIERTFEKLQAKGFETPWAIGTKDKLAAFQTACTWIWGLGGEIAKDDQILLDSAATVDALVRYFNMYRFMPREQEKQGLGPYQAWQLFEQRKVAAVIANPPNLIAFRAASERPLRIGATPPPGPAYVGGSSLVLWRNSRNIDESLQLIRHLTSLQTQLEFPRSGGFIPARSDALNNSYFKDNPDLNIFSQNIFHGRTYANLRLSGLIEDLLSSMIGNVWKKIMTDSSLDVKTTLLAELAPIIRRIGLLWE